MLTDFGCAKDFGVLSSQDGGEAGSSSSGSAQDPTKALSRSCVGTEAYMAPEVQSKAAHGVAVDYWSIGVLLFEMLSGDLPCDIHVSHWIVLFHRARAQPILCLLLGTITAI